MKQSDCNAIAMSVVLSAAAVVISVFAAFTSMNSAAPDTSEVVQALAIEDAWQNKVIEGQEKTLDAAGQAYATHEQKIEILHSRLLMMENVYSTAMDALVPAAILPANEANEKAQELVVYANKLNDWLVNTLHTQPVRDDSYDVNIAVPAE